MPLRHSRRLTGIARTATANRHLGFVLAFVAGAMNASGYLILRQYTSHMTGIVSSMADAIVLRRDEVVWSGLGALIAFVTGAAVTALLVGFGRRKGLHAVYAIPLLLEGLLLLTFGLLGLGDGPIQRVGVLAVLLCFVMGLQNALVTKISSAEIRTTHITGMVTDIGIEFGRRLNRWMSSDKSHVLESQNRVALLSTLVLCFFVGGVVGAFGFEKIGSKTAIVLSILVATLAIAPVVDDLSAALRGRGNGPEGA